MSERIEREPQPDGTLPEVIEARLRTLFGTQPHAYKLREEICDLARAAYAAGQPQWQPIAAMQGLVDTWRSRKREGLWLADAELEITRCADELDGLRAVIVAAAFPEAEAVARPEREEPR